VALASKLSHPPEVHVWGRVSYHGVCCLIEYYSSLNAKCYQEVLLKAYPSITALFENQKWYFHKDSASAHQANSIINLLKEIMPHFISKEDWPPHPPDLSLIENLWAIIDAQAADANYCGRLSLRCGI